MRALLRRSTRLSLALALGSPLIGTPSVHAQSAYDYPWCAIYSGRQGGTQACYYASYAQCRATMDGIGGTCIRSPYYGGAPALERRRPH